MDRRFFFRLGASQLERTICSDAGEVGLQSVLGIKLGTEPEQFAHSRYIIAWGANIHGNNVHLWPFIEEARRKGAKLVVIDPYRTRTAKCADWYLPINPGTDAALALGLMHVIINENLFDADYVSRYTVGFAELKQRAQEYPPEKVAHWTGICANDIRKLAHEYATVRPSVIRVNYGIQRSEGGGMAMRAVTMLPCLIGSWKEVGGGLQMSTSGAFALNSDALKMPELMQKSLGRPARMVNMVQLGTALNTLTAPPIQALFVYNSNPAAVCPNHNQVVRGLMRPDLFTVVHEQFFTDTTDYADIVLPATTFFEHKDLQIAYGHYYLQVSNQAMEPLGECRSNVETFRALAERMGFEDECFRETVDEMIDGALDFPNPRLEGITRERLESDPHVRLNFTTNHVGTDAFVRPAEQMLNNRRAVPPVRGRQLSHAQRQSRILQPNAATSGTRSGCRLHSPPGIATWICIESCRASRWSSSPASLTIISIPHSPTLHPSARWNLEWAISRCIQPMLKREASAMATGFALLILAARLSSAPK
jgi:anaerobic selenocysteine-containing dehydrogenase